MNSQPVVKQAFGGSSSEWTTAIQASLQLVQGSGSIDVAERNLVALLQQGAIAGWADFICQEAAQGRFDLRALAESNYKTSNPHVGQTENTFSQFAHCPESPLPVPLDFFLSGQGWEVHFDACRFDEGFMVATRPSMTEEYVDGRRVAVLHIPPLSTPFDGLVREPRIRRMVSGLRFKTSDIESLMRSRRPTGGPKHGQTAPRRKKWNYAPIMALLQSEILSGDFSRFGSIDGYGTQAKIEDEIANALTTPDGLVPPEPTVRRRAQSIMKLWRDHSSTL